MDAQKQLQTLSDEFQQLQTGKSSLIVVIDCHCSNLIVSVYPELEGLVDARQKLESQQQENQGVQSEFNQLDDESNIYKLVGPVLLKQEKTEALMAVNGRLEFIEKEMWVSQPNVYSHSSLTPALARELRRKSMESRKPARRSAPRYRETSCNSTPWAHADLCLDRAGPNPGPTASCLCLCVSLSNFKRTLQWRESWLYTWSRWMMASLR